MSSSGHRIPVLGGFSFWSAVTPRGEAGREIGGFCIGQVLLGGLNSAHKEESKGPSLQG